MAKRRTYQSGVEAGALQICEELRRRVLSLGVIPIGQPGTLDANRYDRLARCFDDMWMLIKRGKWPLYQEGKRK